MTTTFHCCPIVCPPCGDAAEQIQRKPLDQWASELDALPDDIRDCVREYLRGIHQRVQVIEKARAQR